MISKSVFILFFIFLLCNIVFGSGLFSEKAIGYYNEGVRAQKRGDFYTAQMNYQKSILLGISYKKFVFNNMGVLYANLQDTGRAETTFKEALMIDPNYDTVAYNLSLLYLKLSIFYKENGDVKNALENLEKAFYYHPKKSYIIEEEKGIKGSES